MILNAHNSLVSFDTKNNKFQIFEYDKNKYSSFKLEDVSYKLYYEFCIEYDEYEDNIYDFETQETYYEWVKEIVKMSKIFIKLTNGKSIHIGTVKEVDVESYLKSTKEFLKYFKKNT